MSEEDYKKLEELIKDFNSKADKGNTYQGLVGPLQALQLAAKEFDDGDLQMLVDINVFTLMYL